MKSFFAASLFLGLASISQATTIVASCTGTGLVFGSQSETCTTNLPGDAVVSAVTIAYSLDIIHTDNNAPASADFSFAGPGGGIYDFTGNVNDGNRAVSFSTNVASVDLAAFSGTSFTINDTFSNVVNVQAYNIGKTITITYSQPVNPTPEPSTFVMLGTALTAVGALARRRKA